MEIVTSGTSHTHLEASPSRPEPQRPAEKNGCFCELPFPPCGSPRAPRAGERGGGVGDSVRGARPVIGGDAGSGSRLTRVLQRLDVLGSGRQLRHHLHELRPGLLILLKHCGRESRWTPPHPGLLAASPSRRLTTPALPCSTCL